MRKTIEVSVGARPLFRRMPGGAIMMPMQKEERAELVDALREVLSLLDDVRPRDDAKESG
jgi:hypothetical protein